MKKMVVIPAVVLVASVLLSNSGCLPQQVVPDATSGDDDTSPKSAPSSVETPTFSPGATSFADALDVTISCATPGATIRYTTDGVAPSLSHFAIAANGASVHLSSTTNLKAVAFKSGMTDSAVKEAVYTKMEHVAQPTFDPDGGNFTGSADVIVSCTTPGATIRYTLDGSTPSHINGFMVSNGSAVRVTSATTLKAIAFKNEMADSTVKESVYFRTDQVAQPMFSPDGGPFDGSVLVRVSCTTSEATIRYTTDGSAPSQYNGKVLPSGNSVNITATTTLKAIAYKSGMTNSPVKSATYTKMDQVAQPTFAPDGGSFADSVDVTVSCSTPGATIRYTTDSSALSQSNGSVYSGPVHLTATTTLKAISYANGMADSAVKEATFTKMNQVAQPTFNPDGGSFADSVDVTISCSTPGATIRYTTDGSPPSQGNGAVIEDGNSITINNTTTLKAIAYKSGMTDSTVKEATYTKMAQVARPTFSPDGGTFASSVNVTISCDTAGATIRYTTDGNAPSQSTGTIISSGSSVRITATTTLKAIAYKSGMTDSTIEEAMFTIPGDALWQPLGSGMDDTVRALTVCNGLLIAGGVFTSAGGVSANRIARWDGSTWQPLGSGMNDGVATLTAYNDQLIAGGWFTGAGGVSANRIARWDGTAWQSFRNGSSRLDVLTVYDGLLTAGGVFFTSDGGVIDNCIARWDGTTWQPLGSGINEVVAALTVYNGQLIAGGLFSIAGGVSANYIARWDGSTWQPLGSGLNGPVTALTVYNGQLIAGGYFTTAGGLAANRIARWDGATWQPLGSGIDGAVQALAVRNGQLIAGGLFSTAGGVGANSIVRWDGATWQPLGSGIDGTVCALTVYSGQLIAGGYFTTAGGISANRIASYGHPSPCVAAPTFAPDGGTFPGSVDVTISTTTSGATVRYTTDESTPTSSYGTVYAGPVHLDSTRTIKAIAYKSGMTDSDGVDAFFTVGGDPNITSAIVDSLGGILHTDSGLVLAVPQDAISATTLLTLSWERNEDSDTASVVKLEPDGLVLQAPAQLTIPMVVDPNASDYDLRATTYSRSNTLQSVGPEVHLFTSLPLTVDSYADVVAVPVTHFSYVFMSKSHRVYVIMHIPGKFLRMGDLLYMLVRSRDDTPGSYDWWPGHAAMYLGTTDTASPQDNDQNNNGDLLCESIPISEGCGPLHSILAGDCHGVTVHNKCADYLDDSGVMYMGARRHKDGVSASERTHIADYAIQQYTQGKAYVAIGEGNVTERGFSCVGLLEAAYDAAGKSIIPWALEMLSILPVEQFRATVAVDSISVKVGESIRIPVRMVYWHSEGVFAGRFVKSVAGIQATGLRPDLGMSFVDGILSWVPTSMGTYLVSFTGTKDYDGKPVSVSQQLSIDVTSEGTVATPTFEPDGGSFATSVSVKISCTTSGATIRYTTDGTAPSQSNGTVIPSGNSITISNTTTLKAIAYESGMTDSTVKSATYTITPAPSITVSSPNGGETWTVSTSETVTWTSTGSVGNVNIDLSTNGGSSWTSLVSNTANDGAEPVTVPNAPSMTCRIRVQETDGSPSDTSANDFTIKAAPNIAVTSPNGNETWTVGTSATVTWTSTGTGSVGNVNIDLSTNGGSSWTALVSNTANDGTETVTVPNSPSTTCRIRVQETDGSPSDMSDADFTIVSYGSAVPPGSLSGVILVNSYLARDSEYSLIGDLTVNSDAILTVLPGARVVANGVFGITGRLRCLGEGTGRITFTSGADVPGSWKGLTIFNDSLLNNTDVFYSQNGISIVDNLGPYDEWCQLGPASTIDIGNCRITQASSVGILRDRILNRSEKSTVRINAVEISGCGSHGVLLLGKQYTVCGGATQYQISDSTITTNGGDGIRIDQVFYGDQHTWSIEKTLVSGNLGSGVYLASYNYLNDANDPRLDLSVLISDSEIRSNSAYGIWGGHRGANWSGHWIDMVIINSAVFGNSGAEMYLENVGRCIVGRIAADARDCWWGQSPPESNEFVVVDPGPGGLYKPFTPTLVYDPWLVSRPVFPWD